MTDFMSGLWVAAATPINAAGAVDRPMLVRHAQWLISEKCDGLVLFGTTGEGPSFTAYERLAATEALLQAGIPADRLALSTGFPAIADTIELTRQARALGLAHILILPPYFYRDVTPGGLEDAFAAILDATGDAALRATLYHIPQVSGVGIPADVVGRLRARFGPMLAGVKDSSGDFDHFRRFRQAAPDVAVAIGNEADITRALAEGGAGAISGMANAIPRLVRTMFAGTAAIEAMREALALMRGPFVPGLKAALAAMTGEDGWARVRPPLRSAVSPRSADVAAVLRRLESAAKPVD